MALKKFSEVAKDGRCPKCGTRSRSAALTPPPATPGRLGRRTRHWRPARSRAEDDQVRRLRNQVLAKLISSVARASLARPSLIRRCRSSVMRRAPSDEISPSLGTSTPC